MNIISTTTEKLSQMNQEPVVMLDKVYLKHTLILTKRVVTEYKDHFQTQLTFTITDGKE